MIKNLSNIFENYFVVLFFLALIASPGITELLLIILFLKLIYKVRLKILNILYEYWYVGIFFLMILITSIFNSYEFSLKGVIYLRFLLYFCAVLFFIKQTSNNVLKFLILLWLIIIFDLVYQYITGVDLFGFKSYSYTANEINKYVTRLTGPFDNSRSGFYLVIITILISINYIKNQKYLNLICINFFNILIIPFTGERTSLIYSFLLLIGSLTYINKIDKKIIFPLITLCLVILFVLFKTSPQKIIDRNINLFLYQVENFNQTQWFAHYNTSYNIFREYPILGAGIRSYRNICSDDRFDGRFEKKFRCSTHPHNKYLEILSETGSVGIITFIFAMLYIFRLLLKKKECWHNKIFLLIIIYILLDPILPSKSFFNNWMSSIYWTLIAYIFNFIKYQKK